MIRLLFYVSFIFIWNLESMNDRLKKWLIHRTAYLLLNVIVCPLLPAGGAIVTLLASMSPLALIL